jgi:membrane dipeptidase
MRRQERVMRSHRLNPRKEKHASRIAPVGLALLVIAFMKPLPSTGQTVSDRAARLHEDAVVVDLHIDTPQRMLDYGVDLMLRDTKGHVDLPRMREGGLDAAFFSIYVDMDRYPGDAATRRALRLIDSVTTQVERRPDQFLLALSAVDIRRAHREGRVAVLMGMEGGTPIADDLGLLRNFYRLGVRYMTLTHGLSNNWVDSSTDPPRHNGLTEFGKDVVREMNRLGMLVDISHVSDKAFDDALEVSQAPLIASHSSARAISNVPRNMTDDMIRALAAKGGVVHVNYYAEFLDQDFANARARMKADPEFHARSRALREQYRDDDRTQPGFEAQMELFAEYDARLPRVSWERIIEHIDHMVKLVGADHVGLGSDFDGATMPDGMNDVSYLPRITQALLDRGYSDADIRKILGENTLRVMEEAEQVAERIREAESPAP